MQNVIYAIRNTVNGKVYIGQSRQGLAHRRAEHIWRLNRGERDHKIYQAMRKYGPDAFKFEVIFCAFEPEYLDAAEVELIAEFNSYNRGYNSNPGGNGVSTETRAKISKAHKGRKAPWAGLAVKKRWAEGRGVAAIQKKGAAHWKARSYIVREPSGDQIHITGLKAFCRERSLTPKCMFDTLNGVQTHHKGFALIASLPNHAELARRVAA